MEEAAMDSGHRASVSMPSLDATDDFPNQGSPIVNTEDTDPAFITTEASFTSVTTETTVSSSGHTDILSTDTVSFSSAPTTDTVDSTKPVEDTSSEPLVDENSTEGLINETTTEILDDEPSTEPLIEKVAEETLIDETLTEPLIEESSVDKDAPTETLIDEVSAENLIDEASSGAVIDGPSTDALIEGSSTEPLLGEDSEVLQQEGLDDSQGEEDPSIAIDQFIKKIADEQLSSKRIEERKEEEAQEQSETLGVVLDNITEHIEDSVEQETNAPLEDDAALEPKEDATLKDALPEEADTTQNEPIEPSEEPSSLENTLTEESPPVDNSQIAKSGSTEPMEVDSDEEKAPTQQQGDVEGDRMTEKSLSEVLESEDNMMESIEEIRKEIARIPPKKAAVKDETKNKGSNAQNGMLEKNANQNENHTQESIEQILGEDISTPDTSVSDILKTALKPDVMNIKGPSIQDSSEVARDSDLIEKAQDEFKKLDVLVCGECHNTFYYTQEFLDHKNGQCPKKSALTGVCENESKPQVWGFILWKIKQTKDLGSDVPSSWSIYQRWCKLPQADKNAWITAGQSIQFSSKIGNARVTEVRPSRQTKQVIVHKVGDKEQPPPPPIEFVDSNKENSSSMETENTASNIIKRGISKPVKLNNDVTILPSSKNASATNSEQQPNSNKAVRTTKVLSAQKEEYVVEKIMAKRFNPRKKTWEYNIKWENFGHDSNTWEPIGNLSHCKILLEQFEEQLKRMKEEKAKQAAQSPKVRGRPSNPKPVKPNTTNFVPIAPKVDSTTPRISNVVGGVSDDYAGGSSSSSRPQRSSKQKALSQVKQWCGNISDEDSGGGLGLKRKHETDDSDEDYDEKRIKLEDDSDFSDKEEIKPKISIKKVTSTPKQTPVKNGNTGAQQVLPSNILIPDANGVVRINQKQLPSLSSGVYIMSKTAGIIKLDSTTSKVATSGGQTIVKVAPKIGQTQIKIVKKDGNTTKQIIQVSPKPTVTTTPIRITPVKTSTSNRFTPKIRKEVTKAPPLSEPLAKFITKKPEPITVPTPSKEDESDDGLEPLPFPGPDEPIPDLEETQDDEFVLDPLTGKIAGVEYVDKPVVIKEEPQPVAASTNDLENIVKLAAAEISESDAQSDGQMELDPLLTETKEMKSSLVHQSLKTDTGHSGGQSGIVRKVVKYTTAQGMKTENSILNKVLTQGSSTPRAIISPVKTPAPVQVQRPRVVQQRVINQMVARSATGAAGPTRTVVRHVVGPRSSTGGNMNVIRKTISSSPRPRFNLTPQKPLASPMQPTRTYSAMGGIRQHGATPGSKVQVYSTKGAAAGGQTGQVHGGVRRIGNTVVRSTSSGQLNTVQKPHSAQYAPQKQPVTRIIQRAVTSPKKPDSQPVVHRNIAPAQPKPAPLANVKPKTVISMPSLTGTFTEDSDEDAPPPQSPKVAQKPLTPQKAVPQLARPAVKTEPPMKVEDTTSNESVEQSEPVESATSAATDQGTDWSSFTMADGDNPIYVTGDDGTIYQVAGQNEQGQTILITQGPDGQQQCLLVTNEIGEMASEDQPAASTSNAVTETETAEAEEATTMTQEQETESTIATPETDSIQTPLHIKTDATEMEGIEEGVSDQVVAQVVRAEPPSPGGTHKVVVMLPDGNLMVTQVSPEEYASLELE